MQEVKKHIAFRIFAIVLVTALFAPSAAKFVHAFTHHKHKVCATPGKTHIHQVDLDCEFYKFQLNKHFLLPEEHHNWLDITQYFRIYPLTYKFLHNHRTLSFSLRGPPVLV
ncbi:hypothetical protein [Jejuia pallidilutea]|uniref:hypothetical protein n=1 Tax=Jejuia pallidilutea TaxID=504487 RepID=UPI0006945BF5|nr:hypothetical protein [Jejuia pallidilutea]